MRVLIITKLFPNAVEPVAAPFNRQQFAALSRYCDVVEVMGTIPWPLTRRWSSTHHLDAAPEREEIAGLPVSHPRTIYMPRLAVASGPLYAASMWRHVRRHRGRIDVILSAWAYPDGWASVVLGAALGVPVVIKVHGSDINVVANMPGPRRLLRWGLPRAARIVSVSRPLAEAVAALGVPRDNIVLVHDGVDASLFHPRDRGAARAELGRDPDEKLILYVGYLKRTKGVLDLLEAFERVAARLPSARLAMVGDGDTRAECEAAAERINRAHGDGRVTLAGVRPHAEIGTWMGACDVLTLPSWAEGTPSVILEALACGRRVVASDVGGIPDVIDSERLGDLAPARDIGAIAAALERGLTTAYDPADIAAEAQRGDWSESAQHLYDVLVDATAR